jgi:hypothetical protein
MLRIISGRTSETERIWAAENHTKNSGICNSARGGNPKTQTSYEPRPTLGRDKNVMVLCSKRVKSSQNASKRKSGKWLTNQLDRKFPKRIRTYGVIFKTGGWRAILSSVGSTPIRFRRFSQLASLTINHLRTVIAEPRCRLRCSRRLSRASDRPRHNQLLFGSGGLDRALVRRNQPLRRMRHSAESRC